MCVTIVLAIIALDQPLFAGVPLPLASDYSLQGMDEVTECCTALLFQDLGVSSYVRNSSMHMHLHVKIWHHLCGCL